MSICIDRDGGSSTRTSASRRRPVIRRERRESETAEPTVHDARMDLVTLGEQRQGLARVEPLPDQPTLLLVVPPAPYDGVGNRCGTGAPFCLVGSQPSRRRVAIGRLQKMIEGPDGPMLVQLPEDNDQAAVPTVAHGLEHLDRPIADRLRQPPDMSGQNISRSRTNAVCRASHLCKNEAARRIHPVPVDGPKQVIGMITHQPVVPANDPGHHVIDGQRRLTVELPANGRRPGCACSHEDDAEAQDATCHQWRISQNCRASAATYS